MTGAGLNTVSMLRISNGSFVVLALLAIFGSQAFILTAFAFIRKMKLESLRRQVDSWLKKTPIAPTLSTEDRATIAHYHNVDIALEFLVYALLFYLIIWIFAGTLWLYSAFMTQSIPSEIKQRGLLRIDNAAFLSVSAFTNCGLTITSNSLIGMKDNPIAYVPMTFLILAGGTCLPLFLRSMLRLFAVGETLLSRHTKLLNRFSREDIKTYRRALQMLLNHPRSITCGLFDHFQSLYLGRMVLGFIVVQYVFFIASTMRRRESLDENTTWELLGIGYFQTLSTRSAGFSMMDLRTLNQGLLVIYVVMMYLSAFPLVSTIQDTQDSKYGPSNDDDDDDDAVVNVLSDDRREVSKESRKLTDSDDLATHDDVHESVPQTNDNEKGKCRKRVRFHIERDSVSSSSSNETTAARNKLTILHKLNQAFAARYLFRHTSFLLLALLICAYSEDHLLQPNHPSQVNLFYIFFELISAYGNVGLSMGIPGESYSLSGAMTVTGRTMVMAVMLLGKTRGLPSSSDEVVDFEFLRYLHAWHFPNEEKKSKNGEFSL
eukprot:gene5941-6541_t